MVRFYVGDITGTTPQTVKIYTDSSTSIDVSVSEGNKWYSYVLPKDKGLCAITGNHQIDDIITKVIVKANISYHPAVVFDSIIPKSTIEASFKGSNTSKVANMYGMFWQCSGLTSLDVSGWDTSNVINMSDMFHGCVNLNTITMVGCSPDTVGKIKTQLKADGLSEDIVKT